MGGAFELPKPPAYGPVYSMYYFVLSEPVGWFSLSPSCQVAKADVLKGHSMFTIDGGRILVEIL